MSKKKQKLLKRHRIKTNYKAENIMAKNKNNFSKEIKELEAEIELLKKQISEIILELTATKQGFADFKKEAQLKGY